MWVIFHSTMTLAGHFRALKPFPASAIFPSRQIYAREIFHRTAAHLSPQTESTLREIQPQEG